MYNAFATMDTEGSKGSTRLHMDMADAVNIMVYAEPCSDGSPGGARWDLFRAEDAPAIRKFLRDRFNLADGLDPIHSQQFYLDKQLRAGAIPEVRSKEPPSNPKARRGGICTCWMCPPSVYISASHLD